MMTNVTEETVTLAQQLYAIYAEAHGFGSDWTYGVFKWDEIKPQEQEAWVQVAQYIDTHYGTQEPDHR